MRRPILVGVALGVTLAASPLVGHAATAPSLTLTNPSADDTVAGTVTVTWSYVGLHRSTPVDVEVSSNGSSFTRVLRTVADNGTPGYFGSATWDTTGTPDGAGYTVRIVMPTNRSVSSSAAPVTIDNTGPTTAFAAPEAEGAPQVAVLADISGTASDALSAVVSMAVTYVGPDGNETAAEVTCACGTNDATWTASTAGLQPGRYEVRAVATDAVGNVGEAASETFVIVGMPDSAVVTGPIEEAVATVPARVETLQATVDEIVATLPKPETVQTTVEEAIAGLPVPDPEAVEAAIEDAMAGVPTPDLDALRAAIEEAVGGVPVPPVAAPPVG